MCKELATLKDAPLGAALETIREEVVLCSVLLMNRDPFSEVRFC
jgi:hypothetical protein